MEEILDILVESQKILNEMEKTDHEAIEKIKNNKVLLEEILYTIKENTIYQKYEDIHTMIFQSAEAFSNTGDVGYKLQPLLNYYHQGSNEIEDNLISLSMKENLVIFNYKENKMEVHDESHIKNDHLFEKEPISLLIRNMASKKDKDGLQQLEEYIEELLDTARKVIED